MKEVTICGAAISLCRNTAIGGGPCTDGCLQVVEQRTGTQIAAIMFSQQIVEE